MAKHSTAQIYVEGKNGHVQLRAVALDPDPQETFQADTPGGVDETDITWVKVRDAARCPGRQAAPWVQDHPAQNVRSAQAEKSWFWKKPVQVIKHSRPKEG